LNTERREIGVECRSRLVGIAHDVVAAVLGLKESRPPASLQVFGEPFSRKIGPPEFVVARIEPEHRKMRAHRRSSSRPGDMAVAGAIVCIGHDGDLRIERGGHQSFR
jgi:hypothetical protein